MNSNHLKAWWSESQSTNQAQPTDTYSLITYERDLIYTLADNVQLLDIPTNPYIVKVEESVIVPMIPATIDFDPDTLNLGSMGKWVTVYIELPMKLIFLFRSNKGLLFRKHLENSILQ